ncbi:male sterility protein-domain-containing protein [Aspergillus heterothallicus]
MIVLVTYIRNEFHANVAVSALYDFTLTVTGLAAMISACQKRGGTEISLPALDPSAEVEGAYERVTRGSAALRRRKRVFLTGATGLLGSQTLRQSLDNPSVDKVIVHVRAATPTEALERAVLTATTARWWYPSYLNRIECVPGDLSAPRLGLSPETWRSLCNIYAPPEKQVTDIIHDGAAVHWQAPYHNLKPVNVDSVVDLLTAFDQWDQESEGSFTFVSGGLQRAPDQDLASFRKVVEKSNGYSQSKSNISIVRPGLIIGTEEEGIPNIDDFQWRLVQLSLRMGAYPIDDAGGSSWQTYRKWLQHS